MNRVALILLSVVLVSCNKEEGKSTGQISCEQIYNEMKEWYLWNDKLPEINVAKYNDPYKLIEDLIYKPLDKWSFINSPQFSTHVGPLVKEVSGHGIMLGLDEDHNARIALVYIGSDLYSQGVRRGWKVIAINEERVAPILLANDTEALDDLLGGSSTGEPDTFDLIKPDGTRIRLESKRSEFTVDAVMTYDTLHLTSGVTGYLVYDSFYDFECEELKPVITYFKSCGVTDLIIDLRYNVNGYFEVARQLSSYIVGNDFMTNGWIKASYNSDKSATENGTYNFIRTDYPLDLKKVVFITSGNTASCSEVVISGLKPYIDVIVVGDKTYGNPVGLGSFMYNPSDADAWFISSNYLYFVYCEFRNTIDEKSFYNGLPADIEATDDITHEFGDRGEASLAAAISFLEGGTKSKSQSGNIYHPVIFNECKGIPGNILLNNQSVISK